jgi:hypothetical protein
MHPPCKQKHTHTHTHGPHTQYSSCTQTHTRPPCSYAESAQGWDAGLQEVALTNADGRELTAKEADLGAVVST